MKLTIIFVLIGISLCSYAQQNRTPEKDSMMAEWRRQTQIDYQYMLNQMGIDSIRQGAMAETRMLPIPPITMKLKPIPIRIIRILLN